MRDEWWFVEREIPEQKVDEILSRLKEVETKKAVVGIDDQRNDVRISDVAFVHDKEIDDMVWKYINIANNFSFGFDLIKSYDVQFTEYKGEENGFYSWHTDNQFANNLFHDRKLTFLLMLSDESEYEGGEFEFEIDRKNIPMPQLKKKGSIIVFPSFWNHRVKEVTRGVRRTLVAWVDGPSFR